MEGLRRPAAPALMRVVALASGSSGNAILVDSGDTRIIVDCGIGPRTLKQRLAAVGVHPRGVDALVVTHEHVDHASGIAQAVRHYGWPVIASAGTLRGLPAVARRTALASAPRLSVGGLDVELVRVAHDAAEPVAVVITDRASGMRAGLAHDLGAPSRALVRAFHGADLVCIEANHDAVMLRTGPYARHLKERIAGPTGHLSNDQAAAFLDAVATPALRAVLLLHLSIVNNTPDVACAATRRGIPRTARRASLAAALRRAPSAPIGEAIGQQLRLAI